MKPSPSRENFDFVVWGVTKNDFFFRELVEGVIQDKISYLFIIYYNKSSLIHINLLYTF